MEKSFLLRSVLYGFLIALLVLPIFHLMCFIDFQWPGWDEDFQFVLRNAFVQGSLSTLITFFLGFLTALGLVSLRGTLPTRYYQILIVALIAPSFLPPLFVVLLGSQVLHHMPTGLWGVVYFHSLMNVGLSGVIIHKIILAKAMPWMRDSAVCGVSPRTFVLKALLPELKQEWIGIHFYFFVLYFFSFSIPLLVGGSRYGGVEVFIYEKVIHYGDWSQAIYYSLLLTAVLFAIAFFIGPKKNDSQIFQSIQLPRFQYIRYPFLIILGLLPTLFLAYSFGHELWRSAVMTAAPISFLQLRGTLIVGLSTGLFLMFLLSLVSYTFLKGRMSKFLLSYVNPGWVVVAFSFLLMPGHSALMSFVKLSTALTLLYLPFLYRLAYHENLFTLHSQVQVAHTFPVSWSKIFFKIIWPQCLPSICFLSGLGAMWACGDFGVSAVLLNSSKANTLALEMKNLLSNYRVEQATMGLLPLLLTSVVVFLIFQGIPYVSRRKFF